MNFHREKEKKYVYFTICIIAHYLEETVYLVDTK